jgi:hypothetical protein
MSTKIRAIARPLTIGDDTKGIFAASEQSAVSDQQSRLQMYDHPEQDRHKSSGF